MTKDWTLDIFSIDFLTLVWIRCVLEFIGLQSFQQFLTVLNCAILGHISIDAFCSFFIRSNAMPYSKFCLKMFELVQKACNTLPHFVGQHQEFLKRHISSKFVMYHRVASSKARYEFKNTFFGKECIMVDTSTSRFRSCCTRGISDKFGQDFYFFNKCPEQKCSHNASLCRLLCSGH